MMKLIILLIGCTFSASCSLTGDIYRSTDLMDLEKGVRLHTIRLERWGELRFSGILALQQHQQWLNYVVLDATGIKLIEAEVSFTGDFRLIRANGPLKTSQLPHYLSTSLKRIYLLDPLQRPCSHDIMLRFCKEPSVEGGWRKDVRVGPFIVWEAEKSEKYREKQDKTVYSQPWLGIRIVLGEMTE